MKIQFKTQEFQTKAVNAVTSLFRGQECGSRTFSVVEDMQLNLINNGLGIGNALLLDKDTIISNMNAIQKENNLPITTDQETTNFCIEMETGTGKTMCFTKTIFELNKLYGFIKFIIVVPSKAIREGIYKSLQITDEYIRSEYDNVPYRFFIYNSAKLSSVRDFATNENIEIMIMNIDTFNKDKNVINQEIDKLNGEKAINLIKETNPIVIIDEPQSVDNTETAQNAISSLNPLCVLRYSATHKRKINLLYRLTPVDAYEMGIVKQISVSSNMAFDDFNKPYIRLLEVSNKNGYQCKVELDIKGVDGRVEGKIKTIKG